MRTVARTILFATSALALVAVFLVAVPGRLDGASPLGRRVAVAALLAATPLLIAAAWTLRATDAGNGGDGGVDGATTGVDDAKHDEVGP